MNLIKRFEDYSIRSEYEKSSVDDYYKTKSHEYSNPHKVRVEKCLDYLIDNYEIDNFLDLSCGDGLVSDYLSGLGFNNFSATDPYFCDIWNKKFNDKKCYSLSFEDISKNGLPERFDTIICSYALHLCEKSHLNNLLYQLSLSCDKLVVISPSKYPILTQDYFKIIDNNIIDRTHIKIYKSILNM
jgi:hypothetical protein